MDLLIVGSVALDSVESPHGSVEDAVGGSAVFGSCASSYFCSPAIVGVVGGDFPKRELTALRKGGVDTDGVQIVPEGSTFRWGGRYLEDMNQRETLFTELNVFSDFQPELPESYRRIKNVFLANIDPDLQLDVLEQVRKPRLVACDTMNLWIDIKRSSLVKLIKKIDVLLLNDEEALMLAEKKSLPEAAEKLMGLGMERLIIKKGEHGALMFGPEGCFACPALPLRKVKDPTGAGDSFAGGMMGWLATHSLSESNWRKAIVAGTAMASFSVQDFSIRGIRGLKPESIRERAQQVRRMIQVGALYR